MMTYIHSLSDRELLALAVEAARNSGMDVRLVEENGYKGDDEIHAMCVEDGSFTAIWNSLTNISDARKLAHVLNIGFMYERNAPPEFGFPSECAIASANGRWFIQSPPDDGGEASATCRAITLAAAAVALAKRGGLSVVKG